MKLTVESSVIRKNVDGDSGGPEAVLREIYKRGSRKTIADCPPGHVTTKI